MMVLLSVGTRAAACGAKCRQLVFAGINRRPADTAVAGVGDIHAFAGLVARIATERPPKRAMFGEVGFGRLDGLSRNTIHHCST